MRRLGPWRSAPLPLPMSRGYADSNRLSSIKRQRYRRTAIFTTATLLFVFNMALLSTTSTTSHTLSSLDSSTLLSSRHLRENDLPKIRYLNFASDAWGDAIISKAAFTYPSKPSSASPSTHQTTVKNNGDGSGSALSAACTQSLVGDAVYDVVTIQFTDFDESHSILAERIRQRFPVATIVFVRLWNLNQIFDKANDSEPTMNLATWIQQHGSDEIQARLLETAADPWSMHLSKDSQQRIKATQSQVNAKLYTLPYPATATNNLANYTTLFQDTDWSRLSIRGHETVARGIQELVQHTSSDVLGRPNQEIGTWGSGDDCHVWSTDSSSSFSFLPKHQTRFVSDVSDAKKVKRVLQVGRRGASVTVHNPFPVERMLSLTYMTASVDGTEDETDIFPRVRVSLNGTPSVAIEPFHEGPGQDHLARTTAVGWIPPGETVVHLDPLQDSQSSFTLVGTSLLAKEAIDLSTDFALQPEPTHESGFFGSVM